MGIHWGQWVGEVVLWMKWKHAGCLIATTSCELLQIEAAKFTAVLSEAERNGTCLHAMRTYANLFAEKYGKLHWPTDICDNVDKLQELLNQAWPSSYPCHFRKSPRLFKQTTW